MSHKLRSVKNWRSAGLGIWERLIGGDWLNHSVGAARGGGGGGGEANGGQWRLIGTPRGPPKGLRRDSKGSRWAKGERTSPRSAPGSGGKTGE